MATIRVHEFLQSDWPMLDVRSPGEYRAGHIPGSHSLPLFSDDERAAVGTCYKKQGQKEAIKLGLELVGPKMRSLVEQAEKLQSDTLNLYCWRGGMRSGSVAWLLARYGFKVYVLDGGYKSYRQELLHYFQRPLPLRILTGYTGSAKTKVLQQMSALGAQVIDLEGLANHHGSSFGNQLSSQQPTTEQFQNNLHRAFTSMDHNAPIWLEDESICIGRVNLPEPLFTQMSCSPHFDLAVPRADRLDHLLADYGQLEKDQLKMATTSISKKLGHQESEEAIHLIDEGDYRSAADIILTYYDRQYRKSIEKKAQLVESTIDCQGKGIDAIAAELIEKECQLS